MATGAQPLRSMVNLQITGLYTNPSTFTNIPAGALQQADDIVIDRENYVQLRRGMARYGNSLGAVNVTSMFSYADDMIIHTSDDKMWYDSDAAGTWLAYPGSYKVPDFSIAGSRVRNVESNHNFYFLTSAGTYKLDSLRSDPRVAGAPQGLSGTGVTSGTPGFFPDSTLVAYRVVWGYRDKNNNVILGAPSERMIVANNTGASATVDLEIQIPAEIDPTWFVQVYRSQESVNLTTQPNDELQQVLEQNPTAGECAAHTMVLHDACPDSLMQGFIYTASSQQGILQANYRPPFARDIAFFKQCVFYANTRTVQTLNESLVSVEAPQGFQIGDTLTFTDNTLPGSTFTLIGGATEDPTTGQFKISSTGDPAIDIQDTAQSMCKIINVYSLNTFVDAYYVSDFNDVPGQVTFQKRSLSAETFYLNCSRPAAFSPPIPDLPVSGTDQTVSSQNDVAPNRVYYSKILQPEAVPLLNYLQVGSLNQPVERIVPLRDGIIVLKQDGVFRIYGDDPTTFAVSGIDNTTRILAPNSADVLDNQVYFLSDQGVVAASDNAVEIMSRPIEHDLLALTSPNLFPNAKELAFGISYNADRKYILNLPGTGTDTHCTQQYCYNTITACWVRWTLPTSSALVFIRDDKLYFGGPDITTGAAPGGYVYQERKTYTNQDFADAQYVKTITAAVGDQLTFADITSVEVGSQVVQTSTASSAAITYINGNIVTLNVTGLAWDIETAVVVYTPIDGQLETVQIDAGAPDTYKQFSEASFIYSASDFDSMTATFSSDQSGSGYPVILTPVKKGGWGTFNWGGLPWGGDTAGGQQRIRKLVPARVQRANWLFVKLALKQCFASFGLSGMAFGINVISTRQR